MCIKIKYFKRFFIISLKKRPLAMPLHGKQLLNIGALLRNPAVLFMRFMIVSSTFWYPLLFIFRKIFMAFTRYITILTKRFWYFSQAYFRSLSLLFWEYPAVIFIYTKKIFDSFFIHSKPREITLIILISSHPNLII